MLSEDRFVLLCPVTHLTLLRVVRDESDALFRWEGGEGMVKGNYAHEGNLSGVVRDVPELSRLSWGFRGDDRGNNG